MPKVTCIVPVYNVEKYLRRCLDSLLGQTMDDYEIICVNDCSPDGSLAILQEYQRKYPDKVRILQNEVNMGQGRSRARAILEAEGEYICFIDSDDYVKTDYMETYLREMEKEPCDCVIGGYIRDTEGTFRDYPASDSDWSLLTYTVAWGKLFRRSFLVEHQIDFSDKRQGEDVYFSLRVYYHIESYRVIGYQGYYYFLNRNSTTGRMNYSLQFERTVADMFDLMMDKCDLAQISEKKRLHIEYAYLAHMINALITYGHGCGPEMMKEKYHFFVEDRKKRFPDNVHNPYVGIFKPKGQSLKIRIGVGVTMLLRRIHLEKMMFLVISFMGYRNGGRDE